MRRAGIPELIASCSSYRKIFPVRRHWCSRKERRNFEGRRGYVANRLAMVLPIRGMLKRHDDDLNVVESLQ